MTYATTPYRQNKTAGAVVRLFCQKRGSSHFAVGWKRDKPYKGKEVIIVSITVGDPLGDLNFVVQPFKFSGGEWDVPHGR